MTKTIHLIFAGGILAVAISLTSSVNVIADDADHSKPASSQIDAAQLKFFEERIRPVLADHCYSCHSNAAKSVKGGLLLDSREGLLTGGDSGPAIIASEPADSLLLQAMKHESLEMPPDRKLSDEILADFETWIRLGAADPRTGGALQKKQSIDIEKGREFWSFRPVVKHAVPPVSSNWSTSDVDRFLIHAREQHHNSAAQSDSAADAKQSEHAVSVDASPDVLIRRLKFVLTGLQPTLEEQSLFAEAYANNAEGAIEQTIDRLMSSPEFGERWGRHWLDVARFAESTGGGRSMMLPDAWRFRDYVIRSFNDDKPFDQLIREHLAGDLLPANSDQQRDEQITGVGYLMLGAINYEEQDKEQLRMDVVDEQIDSMGRTFLGMTIGCCRCHDHKFDPIPTSDYYALAGIFRSTKSLTPGNVCGFVTAPLRVGYDKAVLEQWTSKDADLEKQIAAMKAALPAASDRLTAPLRKQLVGIVLDDTEAQFEGDWIASTSQQPFIGKGYRHCGDPRRGLSATYETTLPADGEYAVRMVINHAPSRSEKIPVLIAHADGESLVYANQKEKPYGDGVFAELGRFHFEAGLKARVVVKAVDASPGFVIVDAIQFLPVEQMPALASSPQNAVKGDELNKLRADLQMLEDERKAHTKLKPEIPVVMCVEEESAPEDWHIHIRGEIRNLGATVPRGFITAATPVSGAFTVASLTSAATSGRRELADWVASPQNPLTARVYVNRVFTHVIGEGLVRTPDNFGETGERPTHPELLDYLAATFIEDGWSTKKLIRRLCLSRTFRLSTSANAEQLSSDPDNRLFTRAVRRRMDAEAVRDSLLQISGSLDLNIRSGRTIAKLSTYDNDYQHSQHPMNARSIFVPSFRNIMLDLFEIFDGANPNLVTGKRTRSTRPAQALYMMNSPFVMAQAQRAAEAFLKSDAFDPDAADSNVRNVWRICVSRNPTSEEVAAALTVVTDNPNSTEAWSEIFHALFASVDFRYLN